MSEMRRPAGAFAAVLVGAVCSPLLIASPAYAQTLPVEEELPPLTGMGWAAAEENLYVVSDQDDLGTIRALDSLGAGVGEITFDDEMISVQALALHETGVYVGDIGDADLERGTVTVYRVDPAFGATEADRYEFAYPDGPQDAAAMAISGIGRLWFITAGEDPALYNAELSPSSSVVNQLNRMADAPEGVTDASFLDDGTTMLLRTATGVQLYDAVGLRVTDETIYDGGRDGESITPYADEQMLVGDADQIRIEPLPSGFATVEPEPIPTPTEEPEPTPTESSPPPEETEESDETESRVERGGTIRALVGAGIVAVGAGVVVFFVGHQRPRPTPRA